MAGKRSVVLSLRTARPVLNFLREFNEEDDLGIVMEDMAEELKASGAPRESVPAVTGSAAPPE